MGSQNPSVDLDGHLLARNPVGSSPRGFVVSAVSTPTYARPNIYPDSPFRSPQSGGRVQPRGVRALTENVLSEFYRSLVF